MREIASGVFIENKYSGVRLGAVTGSAGLLLVDSPIRIEDGREWIGTLATQGRPRYLAVLDYHPDRVLGARGLDVPIVAHDLTRQVMSSWPDTFKGGAAPIGAEADRLKRITGVRKAVPELTFSDRMLIHLGEREIHFRHGPGPTPGSMWVEIPDAKVVFIGDAVTVAEPPYLGEADIEAWLTTLQEMRASPYRGLNLISARDGRIEARDIASMTRFLRRVLDRVEKLVQMEEAPEAAAALAPALLRGYRLPQARREQALLRLQAGLTRLYGRLASGAD